MTDFVDRLLGAPGPWLRPLAPQVFDPSAPHLPGGDDAPRESAVRHQAPAPPYAEGTAADEETPPAVGADPAPPGLLPFDVRASEKGDDGERCDRRDGLGHRDALDQRYSPGRGDGSQEEHGPERIAESADVERQAAGGDGPRVPRTVHQDRREPPPGSTPRVPFGPQVGPAPASPCLRVGDPPGHRGPEQSAPDAAGQGSVPVPANGRQDASPTPPRRGMRSRRRPSGGPASGGAHSHAHAHEVDVPTPVVAAGGRAGDASGADLSAGNLAARPMGAAAQPAPGGPPPSPDRGTRPPSAEPPPSTGTGSAARSPHRLPTAPLSPAHPHCAGDPSFPPPPGTSPTCAPQNEPGLAPSIDAGPHSVRPDRHAPESPTPPSAAVTPPPSEPSPHTSRAAQTATATHGPGAGPTRQTLDTSTAAPAPDRPRTGPTRHTPSTSTTTPPPPIVSAPTPSTPTPTPPTVRPVTAANRSGPRPAPRAAQEPTPATSPVSLTPLPTPPAPSSYHARPRTTDSARPRTPESARSPAGGVVTPVSARGVLSSGPASRPARGAGPARARSAAEPTGEAAASAASAVTRAGTVVRVTIDRLVVRTAVASAAGQGGAPRRRPRLSLEEYLRRRS